LVSTNSASYFGSVGTMDSILLGSACTSISTSGNGNSNCGHAGVVLGGFLGFPEIPFGLDFTQT